MLFLGFSIKKASATSLTAIAVTALAGTASYATSNGVLWWTALALSAGSMTGSYIGARLLKIVPTVVVLWIFVGLVLVLAVRMVFSLNQGAVDTHQQFGSWQYAALVAFGLFAGLLAGLLGVGGGIIVAPLLIIFFGLSSFEAKGTSLVMLIPASIVGSTVNLRNGYVDLRAGLSIGVIAGVVSYAGVFVAKHTPEVINNVLFAILMLFIAIQFATRALRERKVNKSGQ